MTKGRALLVICLAVASTASAQPGAERNPSASGGGAKADRELTSGKSPQRVASASCKMLLAQMAGFDQSLARLNEEARALPEDDPGRCDALRRLRALGTLRVSLAMTAPGCGVDPKEPENARQIQDLDALLASCPPTTPGSCSLSVRTFAQAMTELLQESALGIYANIATGANPQVCKYIATMHGVLIEARADADVIGQACIELLGQGTDEERALLISFLEARQKVERHETALKPRLPACQG
jgi:hypothetical protein